MNGMFWQQLYWCCGCDQDDLIMQILKLVRFRRGSPRGADMETSGPAAVESSKSGNN